MQYLRVAASAVNQTPLDWEGNFLRLCQLIDEAKQQRVQVLCLPELAISGYGCEDFFLSPTTHKHALAYLDRLREKTKDIVIAVGLPFFHAGAVYNCVAVIQNQNLLGLNAKKSLARQGIHYEPRWFAPWPRNRSESVAVLGKSLAFGDQIYNFGDFGLGIEICEEAWDSFSSLASQSHRIQLVLNPSASHFQLEKVTLRRNLIANQSRALRAGYVYSNLVGLEAGRIIYDGGEMVAMQGEIAVEGMRLGLRPWQLLPFDLDLDLLRLQKMQSFSVRSLSETKDLPAICGTPLAFLDQSKSRLPKTPVSNLNKNEEFLLAETLALFDYMRKSGAKGFVLSLSGGVDSATLCVLVTHMFHRAVKELGWDQTRKLFSLENFQGKNAESLVHSCFHCIYQATTHSSQRTESAAFSLAQECHTKFYRVSIQDLVDGYTKKINDFLETPLSWKNDDLTLQNIQARVRAPLAWMIANIHRCILLSTANRSECAVGYTTMDGDTAGGLSPLAGIDKPFLLQWLDWAITQKEYGAGPISSLKLVTAIPPTAELRPKNMHQKDEDDLMPYNVLNRIERYLIVEKVDQAQLAALLTKDFPDYSPKRLTEFINQFDQLWRHNQWKRERFAPSFHLDTSNLDPKTACRFPILSGSINT